MKVVHISTADSGGAGNATYRLHQGLLALGVQSTLLCQHRAHNAPDIHQVSPDPVGQPVAQFNASRLAAYSRDYLWFSFPTSDYANLYLHPAVQDADIVHLHWVGDFLDWPSFFAHIDRPIVWTFHDRNPVLGGLHLEMDAMRLRNQPIDSLEKEIGRIKNAALASRPNVHIVTPSRLLGDRVQNSSRFSCFSRSQIFNAIDTEVFRPYPAHEIRTQLGIPSDRPVLMFLSNDFHQPHKGLDMLVDALHSIDAPFHLLTVGPASQSLGIQNHTHVGRTTDETLLAKLYGAADAFIVPSREDNLPNVMLEALSCGTPVIGTPIGGMVDVIQNGVNGFLAEDASRFALKEAIERFLNAPRSIDRDAVRTYALGAFSLKGQAEKYVDLYRSILVADSSKEKTNAVSETHFSIATSIAPKGLELQRKAIASWQKLGFQVLSFNNAAEVAQLAPQFPDVRFITVSRDGTARSGKPLVYVQDILAWFRDNPGIQYGGFINSDIVVAPENPDAFLALLKREIKGSLIFSRRMEVNDIDVLDGKWNRTGIDLWLWDRDILHCYAEPADYMVGFPHWDYYMELMPICHGIPVKQLAIPNAYHQTHDAYYDWVRDAVPFALMTFKLIYPFLDRIPEKDHLLLPTINYCFKHQPAGIRTEDDLEFLAMFLNTLDKFFLETIDRCSLKLNFSDLPHVPQDQRLSLCHNPQGYAQSAPVSTRSIVPQPFPRISLGTSLSPFDGEKQKIAVASWIAHGFDPISFNSAAEVDQLAPLYPEVRFVTLPRDGFAIAQRPLVYVDDIVAWFRQSGLPYGGFVNADIILKPSQSAVFQDLVRRQLPGSMLFARRVDIESTMALNTFWDTLQGSWVRSGIDLWLFDTAILNCYTLTTDYLVGYPHWDYFMCLWPIANGFALKEIAVPCIFHITHAQRYDFANQMRYAMKTYMHLAPLLEKFPVLDRALLNFVDFFARHQPSNSQDEYGQSFYNSFRYALDTFFLETIFSNCKRISYAHADGVDDVVPGYNHPLHSFGTLEVLLHKADG